MALSPAFQNQARGSSAGQALRRSTDPRRKAKLPSYFALTYLANTTLLRESTSRICVLSF